MDLELIEERASFVCSGVECAFRRWTGDGDRTLSVSSLASGSCPDAATGGGRRGSFDAAAGGWSSRFSDLPAVDSGCSDSFGSSPADAVPVVLLHGFAQSSASWGEVAALLLELGTFTSVYALDFAGHGRSSRAGCVKSPGADCDEGSDAARGEGARFDEDTRACEMGIACEVVRSDDARAYEMDTVCEAVRSFVELVACREGVPPVLVGYSMGGRIALECLVRYGVSARRSYGGVSEGCLASRGASGGQDVSSSLPVSALVLESAGLGPADEDARLGLKKRNAAWARRLREEGVPAFMDYWRDLPLFESQRALSPKRQAAQHAARLANDAEALARTFEGTGAHRQADEAASLAALRDAAAGGLPVLYLAGSLDAKYRAVAQRVAEHATEGVARGFFQRAVEDASGVASGDTSKGAYEAALEGVPGVVVVEGAGHNIHLEEPEEFARILGCFAVSAGLAR